MRLSRHLTDTAGIGARASNETAKASFKPLFDSSIRPHDDGNHTAVGPSFVEHRLAQFPATFFVGNALCVPLSQKARGRKTEPSPTA